MDATTLLISVFCLIDDWLAGRWRRQRGPRPVLADSEVLTIECVGEFLGVDPDKGCTSTSAATGATGFPPWAASTAPPSPARWPIDEGAKQTFDGLRAHLRVCWPGVITNLHDLTIAEELLDGVHGWALGDRASWSPVRAGLLADQGVWCWRRRPAPPAGRCPTCPAG